MVSILSKCCGWETRETTWFSSTIDVVLRIDGFHVLLSYLSLQSSILCFLILNCKTNKIEIVLILLICSGYYDGVGNSEP